MVKRLLNLFGLAALMQSRAQEIGNQRHQNNLVEDFNKPTDSGKIDVTTNFDGILNITPKSKGFKRLPSNSWLEIRQEADKLFASDKSNANKSLKLVNQAIDLNPTGEWLHFDKGMYQSHLGMNREAIESFSKEISSTQNEIALARSYFERAICYFRIEDFAKGFADLDSTEKYNHEKKLTETLQPLRELHQINHQRRLANLKKERLLEELKKPSPEKLANLDRLIEVLNQEKSSSNTNSPSQKYFEKIHGQLTQSPQADYPIRPKDHSSVETENVVEATKHLKERRFEEAIVSLNKQIDSRAVSCYVYNFKGLGNLSLNKTAEAVIDFNEAISIAENFKMVHQDLADMFLSLFTKHHYFWLSHNRGIAYAKLGMLEDALKNFNEEISRNSNSESLAYRGIILKSLGREKEAEQDFEAIKSSDWITKTMIAVAIVVSLLPFAINRQQNRRQQPEQNESIHRTDEVEIRGALATLAESIFTYLDEDAVATLLQIERAELEKICDKLSPAKNPEEVKKIITEEYGEELYGKLGDFLENTYSQLISLKENRTTPNNYPQNFVYNAAIKSDEPVREIDQTMLKKYLGIFDEIVKEKFLKLRAETEESTTPGPQPQNSSSSAHQLISDRDDQELVH